MGELLDSNSFGEKIYDNFPRVYRTQDKENNYALKRYIKSASEGGFKHIIDEANGLVDLHDPQNMDSKYLSTFFQSYGLDVFNGLPEKYLRMLIPRLNDIMSRKGSASVVEYLIGLMTGVEVSVDLTNFGSSHHFLININMNMSTNVIDNFPNIEQIKRILKKFIPFFSRFAVVLVYYFYDSGRFVLRDKFFDEIHEKSNNDLKLIGTDEYSYSIKSKYKESKTLCFELKDLDDIIDGFKENTSYIEGHDLETTKPIYKDGMDSNKLGINDNVLSNLKFEGRESTHLENEIKLGVTNSLNSTLNDGLYLNSIDGYDIIKVNGTETYLLY